MRVQQCTEIRVVLKMLDGDQLYILRSTTTYVAHHWEHAHTAVVPVMAENASVFITACDNACAQDHIRKAIVYVTARTKVDPCGVHITQQYTL